MSSSSTPVSVSRHPLSVSSACHHAPVDEAAPAPEAYGSTASALDEAFRRERRGLLWYLGRKAGPDEAHDLVQEVFARAAGSRQAGLLANPAAFLTRIARNLLIDRARRRKSNNVIVFPLEEVSEEGVEAEQEQLIRVADLQRVYQETIDRLPAKTRRVFLMSRSENLTYRQISEQLGITVATVEYHMTRAIAFIGAAMEAHR